MLFLEKKIDLPIPLTMSWHKENPLSCWLTPKKGTTKKMKILELWQLQGKPYKYKKPTSKVKLQQYRKFSNLNLSDHPGQEVMIWSVCIAVVPMGQKASPVCVVFIHKAVVGYWKIQFCLSTHIDLDKSLQVTRVQAPCDFTLSFVFTNSLNFL